MSRTADWDARFAQDAVLAVIQAYHTAMVDADVDRLEHLVAREFVLVHLTGQAQPGPVWLAAIRARVFEYHRVEVDSGSITLHVEGGNAAAIGTGLFTATIHGTRFPWRLRFELRLTREGDHWVIRNARYAGL